MNETMNKTKQDDLTEKFYLPAVTLSPSLEHIDAVVKNLFDFHGVVPIPTSYNS